MADNFLENHHAEYEQKKQRWLKKKASHLPKGFLQNKSNMRNFFAEQRSRWPLANKNFEDLANVKVTPLMLSTGVSIRKQCNPARIASTVAKIDKASLAARPCFLCAKTRAKEQTSLDFSDSFELLINPFPILPLHLTMPSKRHELQRIKPYFTVMLDFVEKHTDSCIFYNGPRSGASAPDHMHFQVGLVKDVPYYAESAKGKWPGACVSIVDNDRQKVTDEFYRIYNMLPVPIGEYEPMFNVFARKDEDGQYEVTLFLRSQHRPSCYGTDEGCRLVSPGALDMAGLLITPRLEDYETLTASEAEAIYNEVSAPELLDYLDYCNSHEGRKISVGLMETEGEIRCSLNGEFRTLKLLDETFFIPLSDDCSFTIENIVIGVNFHWQQERKLTYSGILRLAKTPEGKKVAINIIPIEDYLKSVISSEMSAMSDKQLLKAHAILSRSWLIANIEGVHNEKSFETVETHETIETLVWYDRSAHTLYDVCADDHCQRYQGITMQTSPLVEEAVEETRGQVLMYDGKVCDSRFSKCCGGRSEEYEYCWDNTPHPYLVSVECPFCNTAEQFASVEEEQRVLRQVLNDYDLETRHFYSWTATYENPDILEIIPLERGKSGRLWKIKLVYRDGHEEIVGKELEIRRRLSDTHLYSSWFNVHKTALGKFTLSGRGWGHGVGLCQIGAAVMASKGYTYDEILKHYFPNSLIR